VNRAALEHILRSDLDLVRVLLRERMVDPAVLQERVTMLSDVGGVRDLVGSRLSQILRRPSSVRRASASMRRASAAGSPGRRLSPDGSILVSCARRASR
jgi:hypothetical protein